MLISKNTLLYLGFIALLSIASPSFSVPNDSNSIAFHCSKLVQKPMLTIADGFSATANINIGEVVDHLSHLEILFQETISTVCDQARSKQPKITVKEPINYWFAESASNLKLVYLAVNENTPDDISLDVEYHLKSKKGDIFILQNYDGQIYLAIKTF